MASTPLIDRPSSFAMNLTQPFPVCMSRIWHYRWPAGDATHGWSLLLEHGIWWRIDPDGQRRMIEMDVSSMYYYDAMPRRWIDSEPHAHGRTVASQSAATFLSLLSNSRGFHSAD